MSARVSRGVPPQGAGRNPQRRKLGFDLNVPPPDHSTDIGTSARPPVVAEGHVGRQQRASSPPLTIDVDSIDDDDVVVLSSPRAVAEARNNSRRNRNRSNVVDVDLGSGSRQSSNNHNKRQRIPPNQPIINCDSYVVLGRSSNGCNGSGRNIATQTRVSMPAPPPPPPPPEPTFSCPVCFGPLVEETSTKCGHIFCKACIKTAIAFQSKCPTCRRKVTLKDTFRIYLPKTS